MCMEISLALEAHTTRVTIAGRPSLGQLCSLLQVLGIDSEAWTADCAVFDLGKVLTPLNPPDKAQLRREAERNLPRLRELAFVWPQEPREPV